MLIMAFIASRLGSTKMENLCREKKPYIYQVKGKIQTEICAHMASWQAGETLIDFSLFETFVKTQF